MIETVRARSIDDALARMADAAAARERLVPLAGGTDLYPALAPSPNATGFGGCRWLDLSALADWRGIRAETLDSRPVWRIGALTRWAELARAPVPPGDWRALAEAAVEVGGRQIQNRGTVGGNLCNASPAADGVPALVALEAELEMHSRRGVRRLPIERFVLGPRRTALADDELLAAVILPRSDGARRSRFLKLGHRRYLVISAVMTTVRLDLDARGRVTAAAVAVGACGPRAERLPWVESALAGSDRSGLAALARADWPSEALAPLQPIDDLRGTAPWRRGAAQTLIRRSLVEMSTEDS